MFSSPMMGTGGRGGRWCGSDGAVRQPATWEVGREEVARPAQRVGSESTRLHGKNVVSCKIMSKVSEVDPG